MLDAKFYAPADLPVGAPLVVVLHGCTQNAEGYDHSSGWSKLADQTGFALLYPEQQQGNNPNRCFNWFRPEHTRRDFGEALSIRHMIEAMVNNHAIDRKRIFVTGLSAGGAMASVMLATYPEVFAAGAIIAGLAYGRAKTVPEAFSCMRGHGGVSDRELWALLRAASSHAGPWPKVTIWQGTADNTVVPSNAEDIAAQWRNVHQVEEPPTRLEVLGARTRRYWCNDADEVVIELNTVAAMGHGTPVGDGLGAAAPYMLEVGVSSTLEIARFWGIVESGQTNALAPARIAPSTLAPLPAHAARPFAAVETEPTSNWLKAEPQSYARNRHDIGQTINQALRAAGLIS